MRNAIHDAGCVNTFSPGQLDNVGPPTHTHTALPVAAAPTCIRNQNDNIIFWLDWRSMHYPLMTVVELQMSSTACSRFGGLLTRLFSILLHFSE